MQLERGGLIPPFFNFVFKDKYAKNYVCQL